MRIDRIENALRQLTGTIEQLQYQNQQLRCSSSACRTTPNIACAAWLERRAAGRCRWRHGAAARADERTGEATANGHRSDAFDPSRQPNAPGAPRVLGNEAIAAPPVANAVSEPPVGVPGGRVPGAPLDL